MKKLKWLTILSLLGMGIIFLVSFGISYFYKRSFLDTLTYTGLSVLLLGILFSMKGRSFLGNQLIQQDSDYGVYDPLEAERESQEIRSQGSIQYVRDNRTVAFRMTPFSMMISSVITLGIAYLLA
ncbi:hypothetical protein D3P08_21755 [Paenibacillus nanensis]|uniref:DUF3899 domain-containing protein n=1 Tax=Paenibacillus nanensis TaxID=393251 RepID=A0A3A1UMV0_9BACL|nr:hypothetical protein [Paenibacillus nanensis]RIX49899.1 hypothetical protein D3P08_21755 [Paenibacillus nanensis]